MSDLLKAILNIHRQGNLSIGNSYKSRNRINNMGEALEFFIRDAFADTFNTPSPSQINEAYSKTFSYLGNQNNPPDAMLKNSDAIEIKKIEAHGSTLALNSSYPKDKLRANNPMLTNACRRCEQWTEKDIIYAVGVVKDQTVCALSFVYGEDYAASHEVYDKIRNIIKNGVGNTADVEFGDTKELGRVNKVDPLGITHLRIRGMWGIENPFRVFRYLTEAPFFAIINAEKYKSFSSESRYAIENADGITVNMCSIKDPNNPSQLKKAILIAFRGSV